MDLDPMRGQGGCGSPTTFHLYMLIHWWQMQVQGPVSLRYGFVAQIWKVVWSWIKGQKQARGKPLTHVFPLQAHEPSLSIIPSIL